MFVPADTDLRSMLYEFTLTDLIAFTDSIADTDHAYQHAGKSCSTFRFGHTVGGWTLPVGFRADMERWSAVGFLPRRQYRGGVLRL